MKQPLRFLQLQGQVMAEQDCVSWSAQAAFADFAKPMQVAFLDPRAFHGNSGIGEASGGERGAQGTRRMGTDCR